MKSARVIITTKCHRNCHYCCNQHESVRDSMKVTSSLAEITGFDSVVLTGGEPTLNMGHLMTCVQAARLFNPHAKVYMQSARYAGWAKWAFRELDGVTFSLHQDMTRQELEDFKELQEKIRFSKPLNFSARLFIMGNIHVPVPLIPSAWDRVIIGNIKQDGDCPAPEDTLFLLKP